MDWLGLQGNCESVRELGEREGQMAFMHRNLRVFRESVDWVLRLEEGLRGAPPQWRWLVDQSLRASGSVALNIAEGSAESGTPQERRFYRIARGSAAEIDAYLCILLRAGLITVELATDGERTMNQISAMLRGLIAHSESLTNSAHRKRPRNE
jgi:four helix bundle protein